MSTRSSARNLFSPLDNLELTLRRRSRVDPTLLNNFEMTIDRNGDPPVHDLCTMDELCQPTLNGRGGPIASIAIQATNFGLKNDMIQQVQNSCQFFGLPGDDANKHIDKFLRVTQSVKVNGVTDDALRLYLFPHSLTHHAITWFDHLSRNSINTFKQTAKMFLGKYFPPSMVTKLRNEIINFCQRLDESLFEAWECYKLSLDRGTFMKRRPKECYDLIENMTAHHNDLDTSAQRSESSSSITPSFDPKIVAPKAEMAEINKNLIKVLQINQQVKAVAHNCETCGGPHSYNDCPATSLLTNKDKLFELARTPLNEHCSVVLLKKLPKKLGDPEKFLIPCDFSGMDECLALADLDASINLMPLYVWNKLSFPKLSPTYMTLELADRSISRLVGVAEDVFVKVGTFHFLADFVVVNFDADLRVPLILERSFLKTRRALIDVYEGKLTLRVGKEAVTFNLDQTLRYSANYDAVSVNRIDLIDVAYEEESDFLLQETDAFLAIDDEPISPEIDGSYYDLEGDIILLEEFLNDDPSSPHLPLQELKVVEPTNEKSSIDEPTMVELKDLPPHLEYAFLGGDDKFPVIIAKYLKDEEKTTLIKVLKSHKQALAWQLSDIKGIAMEFYTHKIIIEDDFNPVVQHREWLIQKSMRKSLTFSRIATMDLPGDIMARTASPKRERFCNRMKCLKIPSKFAKFLTFGDRFHRAVPVFTREQVMLMYGVTHRLATAYHPQTSGQVEVSHRGLKRILERTVGENRASWSDKLDGALWAFHIAFKTPIRLKIFSGKLKTHWSGPFTITQVFPYDTIELSQTDRLNFKVNGHRLKHYFGEDIQRWLLRISKLSLRINEFGDWVKLSDPKQALRGRHPMLILIVVMNKCVVV
nr:reverse transcriptase domain-containing protein [Tanacetum cinerariifolium]